MYKRWLAFNIGCIECGVSSGVVGTYDTKEEADAVCAKLDNCLDWRKGGQNSYEVFDLSAPQPEEYATALASQ
jgi:hypothetical protein